MKRKMNLIRLISSHSQDLSGEFTRFANEQFSKINQEIVDFNVANSTEEKLLILKRMDAIRRYLEDTRPQNIIAPRFDKIMRELFRACQTQFETLGLKMHQIPVETESLELSAKPFAVFLANADPNLINKIHKMLMTTPLSQSWPLFIKKYPAHASILNQYDIRCYGNIQRGNAKNFKLTSLDPNNPHELTLRVDHRLGGARELDTYFRTTELKEIFTPIASPRTVTLDNGRTTTLLITSVCPGGNPLARAMSHKNEAERTRGALNVYQEMAEILLTIQEEGGLFPDAKNSNWLINESGRLCIADTKSIIRSYLKTQHNYQKTYQKNRWAYGSGRLIGTEGFFPDEFWNDKFDIDQFHSYILGVNLQQYLSSIGDSGQSFNYSSFEGQRLRHIVNRLTIYRDMGLFAAMVEIKSLKMMEKCNELIDQLEQNALPYMDETIEKLREEVLYTAKDDHKRFALTKKIIIITKFNQLSQELMFYFLKAGIKCDGENQYIQTLYEHLLSLTNEKMQYLELKKMMDWVQEVKKNLIWNGLIETLRSSTLGPAEEDVLMTKEIERLNQKMRATSDPDEIKTLEAELKHLIQENKKMALFISHFVGQESNEPSKAQAIKKAYYRVHPAEREKILDTKYTSQALDGIRNILNNTLLNTESNTEGFSVISNLMKLINPKPRFRFNKYKQEYATIQTPLENEEGGVTRKRIGI